jgi:hypothetical protein
MAEEKKHFLFSGFLFLSPFQFMKFPLLWCIPCTKQRKKHCKKCNKKGEHCDQKKNDHDHISDDGAVVASNRQDLSQSQSLRQKNNGDTPLTTKVILILIGWITIIGGTLSTTIEWYFLYF